MVEKNKRAASISKYINYCIIALAFAFPLSKAAVNFLELLLIILWIYEGNWKYKFSLLKSNLFIMSIFAFILWMIISIPWASSTLFSINYIGKYHHFLIIPIIYTSLKQEYITYTFSAFITSMFISELISYGIYFELFTFKHATPEFPTPFMHHITYSVVLAFTSTILLVNFLTTDSVKYKIFDAIFFTTIVINLFINGGRTGQVIFMVLIFVVFLMYIKEKLKAFLMALFIVIGTLFMAYNLSENFASRVVQFEKGIAKIIDNNDYTDQGGMRAALWITGTEIFLDNYLIGTGIGNEMNNANSYIHQHDFKVKDMKIFADYHNVFINTAVQLGIIGLFLFIFILYTFHKIKFYSKRYQILSQTFLVSFILFSCTHNTIHIMFPMVYFALFSGLFSAISRIEQ